MLHNKRRLKNINTSKYHVIEGNALDYNQLKEAITDQDIVYANLSGELETDAFPRSRNEGVATSLSTS